MADRGTIGTAMASSPSLFVTATMKLNTFQRARGAAVHGLAPPKVHVAEPRVPVIGHDEHVAHRQGRPLAQRHEVGHGPHILGAHHQPLRLPHQLHRVTQGAAAPLRRREALLDRGDVVRPNGKVRITMSSPGGGNDDGGGTGSYSW